VIKEVFGGKNAKSVKLKNGFGTEGGDALEALKHNDIILVVMKIAGIKIKKGTIKKIILVISALALLASGMLPFISILI
jgi:hypothetical protein